MASSIVIADGRVPNMVIMQYISLFFSGFILSELHDRFRQLQLTLQLSFLSP